MEKSKSGNETGIGAIKLSVEPTATVAGGSVSFSNAGTASPTVNSAHVRMVSDRVIKKLSEVTARNVAARIVDFCNEHGDLVTNLKLQRLLYYAQAWYLALHGEKLFQEPIIATASGAIQPEVFKRYERFGKGPIDEPDSQLQVPEVLDQHIAEVMKAYGHLSAYDLELIIRDEEPWKAARRSLKDTDMPEISTTLMMKFYRLRLDG